MQTGMPLFSPGQQLAALQQYLTCVSKSPSVSMSCVAWDHGQACAFDHMPEAHTCGPAM